MAEKTLVKLASFATVEEAHLAKNALEAEGIRVFVEDEASVGLFWHLGGAMGGIKLLVMDDDVPRAQRVLDHFDEEYEERSTHITDKPGPAAGEEAETHVTAVKPVDAEESPEPPDAAEDGDEDEELRFTPGEVMATRAFRAAVFGLFFPLITLYSLWLLFSCFRWNGEVNDRGRRQLFWAVMINGLVMFIYLGPLSYLLLHGR
jgi:hypothetical protein